ALRGAHVGHIAWRAEEDTPGFEKRRRRSALNAPDCGTVRTVRQLHYRMRSHETSRFPRETSGGREAWRGEVRGEEDDGTTTACRFENGLTRLSSRVLLLGFRYREPDRGLQRSDERLNLVGIPRHVEMVIRVKMALVALELRGLASVDDGF